MPIFLKKGLPDGEDESGKNGNIDFWIQRPKIIKNSHVSKNLYEIPTELHFDLDYNLKALHIVCYW